MADSSTKYELQAELRALNRGMKSLPICKMKKHELEHAIDTMKKLKQEKESTPLGPVTKMGRPLSRPVASDSIEDDGVTMNIPVAPRIRQVEKRSIKKKPVTAPAPTSELFPAIPFKPKGKAYAAPGPVKHQSDSDEEMSKKVRKHTHICNCDNCPHGDPKNIIRFV
jgi:hypothetical protein